MVFMIKRARNVHSDKLDRWLGPGQAELYSDMFRDWYGPPVPLMGVPGAAYIAKGGDFLGRIEGGSFGNLRDWVMDRVKHALKSAELRQRYKLNAGFASLSDLISEATSGGKAQDIPFQKSPTTATTVGNAMSCWAFGSLPAAGSAGGTSGTGRVCTNATSGALKFTNPAVGGDTTHITTIWATSSAVSSLMLVDRIWDMTYNHATALSTAIDAANRPTRYQGSTLAPGNFISGEITTALSATAHNITVTYVDDAGNAAEAAAAYAAPVSAVAGRSPTVAGQWFVPLNSGDAGASYLTNIAQSTITSVTGVTNWWIAHPLAMIPFPTANVPIILDGINSAFNLSRIYDNACLALYTPAIATAATINYSGQIKAVAG